MADTENKIFLKVAALFRLWELVLPPTSSPIPRLYCTTTAAEVSDSGGALYNPWPLAATPDGLAFSSHPVWFG